MLMRTDNTPIDKVDVPVNFALGIGLDLQGFEQLLPQADVTPVVEST
ncbi:hypothetical protein H6F72_24875 [Trichocoleus sp. FACHB-46]|nr:hypothetical protein [Trichocoleus sp. FACHB-46]MBD1864505.1 hypothetical protein [Trichocoleus sp. FACHB-46]MBD1864850.1 hypothetical protein [Trichocoleus sp. FACHB-46]